MKECLVCWKKFKWSNAQKYCSSECAKITHRTQKREWMSKNRNPEYNRKYQRTIMEKAKKYDELMEKYKKPVIRSNCWHTAEVLFLKEIPAQRNEMVEYLKGEFIVRPEHSKYTKKEAKIYNAWIQTAIGMIGSTMTRLVDVE